MPLVQVSVEKFKTVEKLTHHNCTYTHTSLNETRCLQQATSSVFHAYE